MVSILMTGRIVDNTILALLSPLDAAPSIGKIVFVVDKPGPYLPKVLYKCPPLVLQRLIGRALSKLILLLYYAVRLKPDLVYAFSIFPHAINAFVVSKLISSRLCISVIGGKDNIKGGGYKGDNWFLKWGNFEKPWMEKLFFAILRRASIVTTMGKNTKKYLEENGVPFVVAIPIFVQAQEIDSLFEKRPIDLVSASSLISRKRLDILLDAVLRSDLKIKTLVLGNGPLEEELKARVKILGLQDQISFQGYTENFVALLKECKCFFMASNSEGLSIAMLSAMACGTVPIVRDVGDLIEAAWHSENAIVISGDNPQDYATAVEGLLTNQDEWSRLSQAGVAHIRKQYSLSASSKKWQEYIQHLWNS